MELANRSLRIPVLAGLILIVLSACSAASNAAPTAVIPTVIPTSAATASIQATVNLPDWATIAFTDARTSQPLTLAQYAGKTIVVEGMAAWCTNCLHQQGQVLQVYPKFGPNVVMISMDVDPGENAPQLAKYAQDKAFPWTFAIAGKPLMNALIAQFGRTITNPSGMPIFMISPTGKVSELYSGGHSADDLFSLIQKKWRIAPSQDILMVLTASAGRA